MAGYHMSYFAQLMQTRDTSGAGYWVLLDPDKLVQNEIQKFITAAVAAEVDCFLVGGSLLHSLAFDHFVSEVKRHAGKVPVILFPGGVNQISPAADAILFLSLISGREAQHLIGSQVLAAPLVHRLEMETIATAYMLIDCGKPTSAQVMSGTTPLPSDKPDIVVAHALAAQYLGFKLIYLEGGSGADHSVPEELIHAVSATVELPVIVGGGIRSPQDAVAKVHAGASFVVTGNILEQNSDYRLLQTMAQAVHINRK
jgi:phosphoglycerol geranylgeranyltransferase